MKFVRLGATALAAAAMALAAPAASALAATQQAAGRLEGSAASFHLPYKDPNQAGWLTLCGTNLKPVTSGSIHTAPFVWRVVSDVPAPKGYFTKGAKSQMFAYQPRPYTPPGAWSGTVMGAASYYSDPKNPMAQFTPIDSPLTQMTGQFPPIWDHLLELRLYLGAPDTPEDEVGYAAADIQVIGSTWHLVAGGDASCTAGKVESVEVAVGMPGSTAKPKPAPGGSGNSNGGGSSTGNGSGGPSASAGSSSSGSPGSSSGSGSGGSNQSPGSRPSTGTTVTPVAASGSSSSTGPALVGFAVGVLVVAAFAVGAGWWRRRRRATG
jgi:hypothetical protein